MSDGRERAAVKQAPAGSTPGRGPAERGHVRMRRALAVLAVAAVLVTGCGVRPSGVIPGLEAPSGPAVPTDASSGTPEVTLYFVRDGAVVPVVRSDMTAPAAGLVTLLAYGPEDTERAKGLRTEVPRAAVPATVTTSGTSVQANLSTDVATLPPDAAEQLVCTLLAATSRAGHSKVTLRGGGHFLPPQSCSL
ncbi:hypothetical protein [Amycolatopsis jiangsuensis]|uniref:GerMN domain-containing protein n=1 Tax=Amycolatopsis jiangsuensis TaxID=1181879 RepID=A0A840IT09_9PSEU|nr:hypothetical protein [Amycolatopsis jiangsuensis]MBB4684288.1 hypothetical protein [Amycolatopsis jiangsuensis]